MERVERGGEGGAGRGRMGGREKRGRGVERVERERRKRCDWGSQMGNGDRLRREGVRETDEGMEGRGKGDGRRKGGKG